MKIAILPYGSVIYNSKGEYQQSFPTEEEAVEFFREQNEKQLMNGGNDDE